MLDRPQLKHWYTQLDSNGQTGQILLQQSQGDVNRLQMIWMYVRQIQQLYYTPMSAYFIRPNALVLIPTTSHGNMNWRFTCNQLLNYVSAPSHTGWTPPCVPSEVCFCYQHQPDDVLEKGKRALLSLAGPYTDTSTNPFPPGINKHTRTSNHWSPNNTVWFSTIFFAVFSKFCVFFVPVFV